MVETVDCWELNRFGTPVTGATARLMSHYHHQGCLGEESSGEVERVGERGYLHVSQRAPTGLASPQTAQNEKIWPPETSRNSRCSDIKVQPLVLLIFGCD